MPSKAIELASFDLYKKAFGSLRPKGADGKRHPSGLGVTVAGALAGVPCPSMPVKVLAPSATSSQTPRSFFLVVVRHQAPDELVTESLRPAAVQTA